MGAQVVADVSYTPPEELEVQDENFATLFSAPLLLVREGEWSLNYQSMQASGSNLQNASGDGRVNIGEHTFFVVYYGDITVLRATLVSALPITRRLQVGTDTWGVAAGSAWTEANVGINVWQIGMTFIPTTAISSNGVGLR